jgi:hypothetical protein
MENVVMFPDDAINTDACGRLLHRRLEEDGSGVVTVDMSDVYASAGTYTRRTKSGEETVSQPLYERCGHVRRSSAFKPSDITGLRSLAVDYSGLSGSPCLIAIADQIQGGGRKVWTWQLGGIQMYGGERRNLKPSQIDRGDLACTTVDGASFVIRKEHANLKASFVAPEAVELTAETRQVRGDVWFKSNKAAGKGITMHSNGVFAEGGNDFLVVITIQHGEAPQVRMDGVGLDAKVTIGKRTIRFDGQNLVMGE